MSSLNAGIEQPLFKGSRGRGRLAAKLVSDAGRPDLMVLALPRGGVPVGYEVAPALRAPLDVFVVRKAGDGGVKGEPASCRRRT